jgi:AhpD family alkylhydroperoxidase
MSEPRLSYAAFEKAAPAAKAALLAMSKAVDDSGLDKSLVELVKLRVSQINNCAFCLQIHLNVARRLGLAAEKIDLVATWQEAGVFSQKECAALAWAEALAHLPDRSVSNEIHARARAHFGEDELMWLSVAIANINAWNRLGAAYRFTPPLPRKIPAAA